MAVDPRVHLNEGERAGVCLPVNKPRSASTGDGEELLGHPRKTGNPTSVLNVEIVWWSGTRTGARDWRRLNWKNPEYTYGGGVGGLKGVKQMFLRSLTVHKFFVFF